MIRFDRYQQARKANAECIPHKNIRPTRTDQGIPSFGRDLRKVYSYTESISSEKPVDAIQE